MMMIQYIIIPSATISIFYFILKTLPNKSLILSFSLSISLSLYLLLLTQIISTTNENNYFLWKIYLFLTILNQFILIPLSATKNKFIKLLLFISSCFYFYYYTTFTFIKTNIKTIGLIGVSLISVLSAYGAISSPFNLFIKNIDNEQVLALEKKVSSSIEVVFTKKRNELLKKNKNSGFFNFFSSANGDDEIKMLKQIINDQLQELDYCNVEVTKLKYSFLYNLFAYILSFYAIYKIISTFFNILFRKKGHSSNNSVLDLLNNQYVSFVLATVLILSSIRNLLKLLNIKYYSFNASTSNNSLFGLFSLEDLLNSLLAFFINCYLNSSLILINASLPLKYRIEDLLVEVFMWNDVLFVISAFLVFGVYWSRIYVSQSEDNEVNEQFSSHVNDGYGLDNSGNKSSERVAGNGEIVKGLDYWDSPLRYKSK